MIGDVYLVDGVEMEVVWDGKEGLLPERPSLNEGFWKPPRRLYNKSGKFKGLFSRTKTKEELAEARQTQLKIDFFGGDD